MLSEEYTGMLSHLAELETGVVGVGVDENLPFIVELEALRLVEEYRVVAITDRDQIEWIGLELELHGEAESLLHLDAVLAAAGWLGEVGGGVAGAGDGPTGAVDHRVEDVDGRLLAASTALEYNCQPGHTK